MMLSDVCLSDVCLCQFIYYRYFCDVSYYLSNQFMVNKVLLPRPLCSRLGPARQTDVVRLSRAHVTRDSNTTFKVKGQGHRGRGILWRPPVADRACRVQTAT